MSSASLAASAASRLLCSSSSLNGHSALLQTLFLFSHCSRRTFHSGNMSGNKEKDEDVGVDKPVHVKCRHPNEYVVKGKEGDKKLSRQSVPDAQVPWSSSFPSYDPPSFTAPFVLTAEWADEEIKGGGEFKWNALDGKVNRKSHEGPYSMSEGEPKAPLNVRGRTGMKGRGVLGRWGPNHAADPVVTRWKRGEDGKQVMKEGKPVLEVVSIQRRDNGQWALPGGMVDPGEVVSATVRREFLEEAMDATAVSKEEKKEMEEKVKGFFEKGREMYAGYVDDPRNTDNSWMETVAFLFHDATGEEVGKFDLKAGDDAKALKWMEVNDTVDLYASHKDIMKKAAEDLGANW